MKYFRKMSTFEYSNWKKGEILGLSIILSGEQVIQ